MVKGTTSKIVHIFIPDSSSTTGAGLTGLVFNSASLTAYYMRPGDTSATAITLATATLGTWATGGFKEVSATNLPGVYEVSIPDACLATGANQCVIMLKGATNMAPTILEIQLDAVNNQDAVRFGISALPNAAAEAAGGLYTRGTGAGQLNQTSNGALATVTNLTNLPAITANWLTSAGISSGALDSVWSAAARTLTAGTNIQLPANGLANVTAWTVALTGNITGNLSGSVGSVTGLTAADVGAIKTKTDQLTFTVANQVDSNALSGGTAPTATANAEALLRYDMSTLTGEASFSPANAMRSTRNDWSTTAVAGKRRVYKEDGSTTAFDQTLGTDPTAVPIVSATT